MAPKIIEVRVQFWVQAEQWTAIGEWLTSHSSETSMLSRVRELTKTLSESHPPVFFDRTSLLPTYLGEIRLEPQESLVEHEVSCKIIVVSWFIGDFLLEFQLDTPFLQSCSTEQRKILVSGFSPCLQALFAESLPIRPEYLATTLFYL